MKKYWKEIAYPLICFFALILSLTIVAKLFGQLDQYLDTGSIRIILFASLIIYASLIAIASYLLTTSKNLAACIAATLIFLFSLYYLISSGVSFTLMIYYFLYAAVVVFCGMSQLKKG